MLYYEPMQIKTYLHDFFLSFLLFNLVSCSSIDFGPGYIPKIHKIDIQQGNQITSEMLMKLKPGMTKAQVRFTLGTPLIQDTFHLERWDYIYRMKVDDILIDERHVILNFVDEKLKNITGEVVAKFDDHKQNDGVGRNDKNFQLDKKKGNNELQMSEGETESSKLEKLPLIIEDIELVPDNKSLESIDTSESINEAIRQDIIDSLPAKDDAGYFDLLLEKIGF